MRRHGFLTPSFKSKCNGPGAIPGLLRSGPRHSLSDALQPPRRRRLLLPRHFALGFRDQPGERDLAEFGEIDPLRRPHRARNAARLRVTPARLPGRPAAAYLLAAEAGPGPFDRRDDVAQRALLRRPRQPVSPGRPA